MRRWVETALAAALVLIGAGCQASNRAGEAPAPASAGAYDRMVWPPPPAAARIRFVRTIAEPRDLGIEKSFFGRLVDAVTGKKAGHLIRPTGIAERDGLLYVADSGAQAVWIFDPANQRSATITSVNGANLVSPVAVAVRPDGSFFVADSYLKKVFLLDREGKFLRTVAEDGIERPAALAYDETNDRLYVADSAGQRIDVFTSDGARVTAWGSRGLGDGEFNFPSYLALERSGVLLVTDALNYRVQAFDRDGKFLWKIGHEGDGSGDFASPKGVAADSDGHLYVVDALFDTVQIFNAEGGLLLSFGDRGTAPGKFWLPEGAFIDRQDRIYVADSFNRRIQVFEFLGTSERPQANPKQSS